MSKKSERERQMKSIKALAIVAATAACVGTAQANDGYAYGNIGVDSVEFDAYNAGARLGYMVTENIGAEVQGSIGIIDDEVGGVDVGVDTSFAGFVRGVIPAGEGFNVFARAGYHATKFGVSGGGVNGSLDTDGFAVGGGVEYFFSGNSGIRGDYTYFDVDDVSGGGDIFSLAYVIKF